MSNKNLSVLHGLLKNSVFLLPSKVNIYFFHVMKIRLRHELPFQGCRNDFKMRSSNLQQLLEIVDFMKMKVRFLFKYVLHKL